jgi:hypothetical protein
VTIARKIFGPDLVSILGKTVVGDHVANPREIVEANAAVTLAEIVFFADGTVFLVTALRKIKFIMAEHVPVHMAKCRGSTRKNVIFSNSLWTNSEYLNSLKYMSI